VSTRLISYSKPPEDLYVGNDVQELIAYTARVSNPSNQDNTETSEKLLRYLIREKHWSPFEMVSACLEVTTTRDIARQLLRHRSFSFQEFSQRYADPTTDLNFKLKDARLQDTKNRQNSIELSDMMDSDQRVDLKYNWLQKQAEVINEAKKSYQWAIENGIAKEQARAVLPEGIMESRLYVNGTIRSWIHYIDLRSSNGTQKEHIELARACAKAIEPIFPMIMEFCHED
jgi:thymidylate synthase (FAD)